MAAESGKGLWSRALEGISAFLPTSIKEPDELPTYTAGLFGLGVILLGLGFVVILVAPFFRASIAEGIATFVVTLLTALMCVSVGAILGLMFGIPRYSEQRGVDIAVAPNNNLEQISDWLTKMIVGISLVQFDVIVEKTKVLALQVTNAMTGCSDTCADNYALGLAVIGFFAAAGFLMMYLWARVYLLLDVGTVQDKISRDAVNFKRFLENPATVQGKERQPELVKEAAKQLAGAMALTAPIETNPDDPWKGVFGGKSRDDQTGRELVAEVKPLRSPKDYCSVKLTVRSTDASKPALAGEVKFFLHDTFPQPVQTVDAKGGAAQLEVTSWGAFTVGVLADGGRTRLELDLSQIETAPADWRGR